MKSSTARCAAALLLVLLAGRSNAAASIPSMSTDRRAPQLLSTYAGNLILPQPNDAVVASADGKPYLPAPLPQTRLNSTWGRTGLAQIFDSRITASQAMANARRYNFIWGTVIPSAWRAGNPNIVAGLYYIMTDDNISYSGHDLAWWKANHPDWIMYGCDASGNPSSTLLAWDRGVGYPEVVLDIHNPAVVEYQLRQSAIPWAISHGYNALSIDQGVLNNPLQAGNPKLGQTVVPGYYGCGVWSHGTFIKRYTSKTDPAWAADVINWLNTAHQILAKDRLIALRNIALSLNHPGGLLSDPNELALINAVDIIIDEAAFIDYGKYKLAANAGLFSFTKNYALYVQEHGKGIVLIGRFVQSTPLTTAQLAYALGTYLTANLQGADMFITPNNYGYESYYTQEAAVLGVPCNFAADTDSANPEIWYRRFTNGIVIVNSGSLPKSFETAYPPLGHLYRDLFTGITLASSLTVNSNEAVIATTTNGCG